MLFFSRLDAMPLNFESGGVTEEQPLGSRNVLQLKTDN
jgi:hypothetical protein